MKILQSNNVFSQVGNQINIHDELPKGIYVLKVPEMGDAFLEKMDFEKYDIPTKLYGKIKSIGDKVIQSYNKRKSLGCMFVGEKGTGKTLLSQYIINKLDLPTIIIQTVVPDNKLLNFLNSINGRFIFVIDEFEKLYDDNKAQNIFLSVLNGVSTLNALTLITANEENKISDYFSNRPKRIRYYIKFEALSDEEINEVINDRLTDSALKDKVIKLCRIVGELNYDLLYELIDEYKDYPDLSIDEFMIYCMNS